MKKVLFTLAMVLAFAVSASAATQEVGPVTMDVPDGWTIQNQGPVGIVISPSQDAVLTVLSAPSQGVDAKEIAENGSRAVNGSAPEADGDAWVFSFEKDGANGVIRVSSHGDQAVVCTMLGENPDLMKASRSVKLK